MYAEIDQIDPPASSEGAATPEEVDEDNLEMQLWLLLQIQKMMQKMDCGTVTHYHQDLLNGKPIIYPDVHNHNVCVAKPNLHFNTTSSPDPPSQAVIQKEINNEDMVSRPTHQDLYENPDNINEAITESSPPPIPPRTYQIIDGGSKVVHASKPPGPASRCRSDQWSQTHYLHVFFSQQHVQSHLLCNPKALKFVSIKLN